jgi:hypothetical protein
MTRLAAIEKMLQLGLITQEQAIADEQLAPNQTEDEINDFNL